jgi:SAM-dependent methyltransferase
MARLVHDAGTGHSQKVASIVRTPTVTHFWLDAPNHLPASTQTLVEGWVASDTPIDSVRVERPDGSRSDPLPLVPRPDAAAQHPARSHVSGFSGKVAARWAEDGEIAVVYSCGGIERRHRRPLRPAVDMALKSAKLRRIAPLLRPDRPARLTEYYFDCLSESQRPEAMAAEVDAVSRNDYDGVARDLIARHAGSLILDAGAGCREEYLPNVVNFEIVPYPSTDVLGTGEDLPFADGVFDAVLSLSVLEHVRDPFACAREITRVLKPGGDLYASVPFLQPYHGYPHHYYNMTHQGLANLFAGGVEIGQQWVLDSGLPIWSVNWLLSRYRDGLPPDLAERFEALQVRDLLRDPLKLLDEDFVKQLPRETQFELAAATVILGRKPSH